MSPQHTVLLLGSNLGNPEKNVLTAISEIRKLGEVSRLSEIITSEPVEFASSNIFCNIALFLETVFSPIKLLSELKSIEQNMGRMTDSAESGGYQDRIIDIDIVTYGNISFQSSKLEIPHKKHLYEREFSKTVLESLANNNIE